MAWDIPKMWQDGECWIIGGGPSMPRQFGVPEAVIKDVMDWTARPSAYSEYLAPLHNKHVIGVNNAYQIGNWIDVLFFGDAGWYLTHRHALAHWQGIKVTCCHRFCKRSAREMEGIKYVARDKEHRHGISTVPSAVSWNGNSGAAAINLAIHFGVKRIVLLGFDMNFDSNKMSHWHGSHKDPKERKSPKIKKRIPPFNRHLRCFPILADEARKLGVNIVNASLESAITQFKKVTVKDALDYSEAMARENLCFTGRRSVPADIAQGESIQQVSCDRSE